MARCEGCIHQECCVRFAGARTLLCGDKADERCKLFKPTADVVPKSEVDRLEEEVAILNEKNAGLALACFCDCMANDDCLGHNEWKAIKADVAREIFEEIEKQSIYHFAMRTYSISELKLAKLKNKYTEEKHEN